MNVFGAGVGPLQFLDHGSQVAELFVAPHPLPAGVHAVDVTPALHVLLLRPKHVQLVQALTPEPGLKRLARKVAAGAFR